MCAELGIVAGATATDVWTGASTVVIDSLVFDPPAMGVMLLRVR